jgi:uncharacterized protein (DUF1015 family)
MANITPFKALRYNKNQKLKDVVCPPYDVISRMQREEYIKKSPYNIVSIVLPDRDGAVSDYKKAKKDLYSWIDEGILRYDDAPALYIYVQEANIAGKKISRCGFLSLLELETTRDKGVLPHENVFLKPLMDRVKLMRHTRAHLSPIFIVYNDKKSKAKQCLSGIIKRQRPDFNIYADNARHKLWRITDKDIIKALQRHLKTSRTFIADGHHRYRASIEAMNHFEKQGHIPFSVKHFTKKGVCPCFSDHRYTLAYLVSSQDRGLNILPTHRAVKALPDKFSIEYIKGRLNKFFDVSFIPSRRAEGFLQRAFSEKQCAFVLYYQKKYIYVQLKDKKSISNIGPKGASLLWKGLDVSVLHNLVFKKLLHVKEAIGKNRNIYYFKDKKELVAQVDSGSQSLGVLLNPSTMDDVIKLAKKSEKMPHKSTYFYPKPLTGLVIHKFN